MLCKKVVRSAICTSRSQGSVVLVSKRYLFPAGQPTGQSTEKTWTDKTAEKNQTPEGVTTVEPGGAKVELHVPKTVGPGDPVKQLDEATLEYNLPAAPPGAHTPRAIGSTEYAPMDSDAYVGPAGATTGPAGKVPTAFERISKRRYSSLSFLRGDISIGYAAEASVASLKQPVRSFSEKIEVNPGGAHVAALDLQDDSQFVVDAAVAEFSDGEGSKTFGMFEVESAGQKSGPQGRQTPLKISRFDERPIGTEQLGSAEGSFSKGVQLKAGQSQADSMGTGGFLNPPPGEVYDGDHNTPDIPVEGDPGTMKGVKVTSVDADGAFGGSSQTKAGYVQADGMGTGGCLNPPPEETFTGGGLDPTGKDEPGSSGKVKAAQLKDANYSVSADSSLPPGVAADASTPPMGRGFFTAPAWFSASPDAAEHKTPGAGPKKDSYAEVKHLPDRPEPVDAGVVTDLQTGVNVIGGTPVKPQADRMTHPDQLHHDTESMQPEIDSRIEKMVPDENTTLAGRPH